MNNFFQNAYDKVAVYFYAGGPLMGPLLLVSLVMWVLILNRIFFFRRLQTHDLDSQGALAQLKGRRPEAFSNQSGAIALLLQRFLNQRSLDRRLDGWILTENVAWLSRRLESYLSLIAVLASIAPLLGLLGTVTGMIATFNVLALFGTGNSRAMAGGISEALITTQSGLLVAIPGLYMHNYLTRRANRLKQQIQRVGLYLQRHL